MRRRSHEYQQASDSAPCRPDIIHNVSRAWLSLLAQKPSQAADDSECLSGLSQEKNKGMTDSLPRSKPPLPGSCVSR